MNNKQLLESLLSASKIYKLPQDVTDSIPFDKVYENGVIKTLSDTYTKSYKMDDVNFKIAPDEEQENIFISYMKFLNMFDDSTEWQICIHNQAVNKQETFGNLRFKPRQDGLNDYRQEMNKFLISQMAVGNNSIKQSKYLTISVKDESEKEAIDRLARLDLEISKSLKEITQRDTRPQTLEERLRVLHSIYNTGTNYPFYNSMDGETKVLDMEQLNFTGLSAKDLIGPDSFDFPPSHFKFGDTIGQVFYLKNVPTNLTTDFIADISELSENLLISIHHEAVDNQKAIDMVKSRLASIDAQAAETQSRNAENGSYGYIPPELERSQTKAKDLMDDILSRDQKLFFLTVTIAIFAEDMDSLKKVAQQIQAIAGRHMCPLQLLRFQQEFAINTTLPLCRNDLTTDLMQRTESTAVFIPYTSQELMEDDAIFYGINPSSKNMILANRLKGRNYNALFFGGSGSGKSFIAKCEMTNVILNKPNSQVFVIDPQGEYAPMVDALNGSRIRLAPGSDNFINPLDLDISDNEDDPITGKCDYVISMIEIMLGRGRILEPIAKTIVDSCVREIYKGYIEQLERRGITCDTSICPTLMDLHQELLRREEPQAKQVANVLAMYTTGSFNTFSKRTTVKTKSKFIVYDIKKLGTGMKELGLFICLNDILNITIENARKGIYTWFYIDEFHLLLQAEGTISFVHRIWKIIRKWKGVPTGITQNTEDLLFTKEARDIFNNTAFIIMLSLEEMDRNNIAELLHLSDAQLHYIKNNSPGCGLLYNGKIILPFELKFPKNTKLYQIMNTTETVA